MKKMVSILVMVVLTAALFAGCVPQSETPKSAPASSASSGKQLKKLRVAVMPFYLSAPVNFIKEQGWDKEAGIDMELIMFSNGAAMNEALGANLWDVAPTGGAAIFGVANFGAKFIADFIDGTGGNEIYVRKDSAIAKVKGFNPTFPELLGDPKTVKGATIMHTAGTTSQMGTVKYLQAIGVKDSDVKIVHMEFPQVYQGFLAGQGDMASMVSPYVFKAPEHGWIMAASLKSLGVSLFETVIASPKSYDNMKDELAIFLKLLYKANDRLQGDAALKQKVVKEWYVKNGTEVKDDQVKTECDLKPLITTKDLEKIKFGKYQKDYAEFLASIQKLTVDQIDVVVKNTKTDILEKMKGLK